MLSLHWCNKNTHTHLIHVNANKYNTCVTLYMYMIDLKRAESSNIVTKTEQILKVSVCYTLWCLLQLHLFFQSYHTYIQTEVLNQYLLDCLQCWQIKSLCKGKTTLAWACNPGQKRKRVSFWYFKAFNFWSAIYFMIDSPGANIRTLGKL